MRVFVHVCGGGSNCAFASCWLVVGRSGGYSHWRGMTPPDHPVCSSNSNAAGIVICFDIRAACNVENTLGRLHFLLRR